MQTAAKTLANRVSAWQVNLPGFLPGIMRLQAECLWDLISALRFDKELDEWHDSLTPDEREAEYADHGEPITDDELMF